MNTINALAASLVFATASAFALPAAARDDHRDNDRHEWSRDRDERGDRDRRDHDRDDDRDHDRRDDDRRYGDARRDDRYAPRYVAPRYMPPRYTAPRAYRPGYVYVAPRGYAVQRWRVGTRMPPPFYVSQYYVDPYAYQLRIPPRGYHWVRVDRDAYLVSMGSGLVADVLYGLFR
ncbi:hypothetical protein DWG18_07310 [Lysobacter sp. TY2-98]|uniref:RcnB family protein n=1 Tax=Lysobacter sp. TY2-98 TaxID=2290922 RepID=UPI000E201D0B|nr:RcnB family protein [Lysobacter sp. TY2-98]AXK72108.1 hypothetical protein DWG18_07310 [Lysobacter sp. TY2-98]